MKRSNIPGPRTRIVTGSRISAVFGMSRFAFLCVLGLSVGAAWGAKGADGLEPELEQKSKATNQSALVRPPSVIPTEEAQQALKRMKTPAAGSGTWRQISVFDDTTSMQTNIVYEWQGPEGKKLERHETIQQVDGSGNKPNGQSRRWVWVRNEGGMWTIHERVAILFPPEKPYVSDGAKGGSGDATGATNGAANSQAGKSGKDYEEVIDENDPEILADLAITGERLKEGERVVLLVSKRMGPKAQKRVEVLTEQKIKEMKKEIPLLLRPLLTVSMFKGMLAKILPVRTDLEIDEKANTLIVNRGYAKDGRFIMEEWSWTLCPDLPPESYEVPKNLKVLRPKTRKEADQLEEDARKEDEKIRQKKN